MALGAAANVSDAEAESIESLPEDGTLGIQRTEEATQIDEIFNALDDETRSSFQNWQRNAAIGIEGRGLDLNDSLGNLGPFITDASETVAILERQKLALKGLVRDTGVVFEALTERDQELARVIVGSDNTFDALASEDAALAEIFRILPTFQRESRATFERLDEFQVNTKPLFEDLIPVAQDLSPTLRSVRELAPNLRSLFVDLRSLNRTSVEGLPALRDFLDGLTPVLDRLDPFLSNLNPVLRYLEFNKKTVTDFLVGPGAALGGAYDKVAGDPARRHGLRQLSYLSTEAPGAVSQPPGDESRKRLSRARDPERLQLGQQRDLPQLRLQEHRLLERRSAVLAGSGRAADPPRRVDPGDQQRRPSGPAFAPCHIQGALPSSDFGSFGEGRFPGLFHDP